MYNDSDRRRESSPRGGRSATYGRDGEAAPRRGTPLSELDPALTSISHRVIGCARDVHMALGPGFDVAVYATALQAELNAAAIAFKANHAFDVQYKGASVGRTTADLFIADRFVVTVMAKPGEIGSYERAVLRAQLRAGDLELGLIINFAGRLLKDGLVRVLNPDKLNAMKAVGGEAHDDLHDDFGEAAGGGAYDPDARN